MLNLLLTSISRLDVPEKQKQSIDHIPESLKKVLECEDPPKKPKNPVYRNFSLFEEDELPITVRYEDFGWLLGRSLSRVQLLIMKRTRRVAYQYGLPTNLSFMMLSKQHEAQHPL